jgi:hypothetical protein
MLASRVRATTTRYSQLDPDSKPECAGLGPSAGEADLERLAIDVNTGYDCGDQYYADVRERV